MKKFLSYIIVTLLIFSLVACGKESSSSIEEDMTLKEIGESEEFDIDGDGLSHKDELAISTDPYKYDTDGDGVSDGDEVLTILSDPLQPDTDGDGLLDGVEVELNLNPLTATTDGKTNDSEKKVGYSFSNDENKFTLKANAKANVLSSISTSFLDNNSISCADGLLSRIIDIEKSSSEQVDSAELIYFYGDENLENLVEDDLCILYLNEETNQFEKIPSIVDKENKTVTATLTHFSRYAVGDLALALSVFSPKQTTIVYDDNKINANEIALSGFDLYKHSFAFHNFRDGYCYGFSLVSYLNYMGKLPVSGEKLSGLHSGPKYDLSHSSAFYENKIYLESEKNLFNEENDYKVDKLDKSSISQETLESINCIKHWEAKQHNVLDHFGANIINSESIIWLQSKLLSGEPVLLTLYTWGHGVFDDWMNGGSHSVLAYGMYQTNNADYILIYDSNHPGEKRYIKMSKCFSFYTSAEYENYSDIRISFVTIPDGPYVTHEPTEAKAPEYTAVNLASKSLDEIKSILGNDYTSEHIQLSNAFSSSGTPYIYNYDVLPGFAFATHDDNDYYGISIMDGAKLNDKISSDMTYNQIADIIGDNDGFRAGQGYNIAFGVTIDGYEVTFCFIENDYIRNHNSDATVPSSVLRAGNPSLQSIGLRREPITKPVENVDSSSIVLEELLGASFSSLKEKFGEDYSNVQLPESGLANCINFSTLSNVAFGLSGPDGDVVLISIKDCSNAVNITNNISCSMTGTELLSVQGYTVNETHPDMTDSDFIIIKDDHGLILSFEWYDSAFPDSCADYIAIQRQ